jgi:hypothetical protein
MDRATAQFIREALNQVLGNSIVNGEYTVSIGNCSYNDTDCTFKVTVAPQGAASKEERDMAQYAGLYKLDINKVYTDRTGRSFTLSGYKSKARKNPWIITDLAMGKDYVISDDTAINWFKKDSEEELV